MSPSRSRSGFANLFQHDLIAAPAGIVHSMTRLGICYFYGQETPIDLERAVYWLSKGVEAGDARAMLHLALAYEQGTGVDKDLARAYRLLISAVQVDENNPRFTTRLRVEELKEIYSKLTVFAKNGWGISEPSEDVAASRAQRGSEVQPPVRRYSREQLRSFVDEEREFDRKDREQLEEFKQRIKSKDSSFP